MVFVQLTKTLPNFLQQQNVDCDIGDFVTHTPSVSSFHTVQQSMALPFLPIVHPNVIGRGWSLLVWHGTSPARAERAKSVKNLSRKKINMG